MVISSSPQPRPMAGTWPTGKQVVILFGKGQTESSCLPCTQACYYIHEYSEIMGDLGCSSARCEKFVFRLRALDQKHHSHTTQPSGHVPTQPTNLDLLKTFQGVTLGQKFSPQMEHQLCSCSQHKAHKLAHSSMTILVSRYLTMKNVHQMEICNHVDPILNQQKLSNIFSSAPMYHTEYHALLCVHLAEFGQPEE